MASLRTAGLLVLGSKRDEDGQGGRRYLDGLAMQYLTRPQQQAPIWRWLHVCVWSPIYFHSNPQLCLLYLFCKMYSMFKHFLPKWSSRHCGWERGFALRDEGDNKNTSWHCGNIPSTLGSQRSAPHRHFLQPSKGEKHHYFVFSGNGCFKHSFKEQFFCDFRCLYDGLIW